MCYNKLIGLYGRQEELLILRDIGKVLVTMPNTLSYNSTTTQKPLSLCSFANINFVDKK